MTRDEKLAVIAGNLRDCLCGGERINSFLEGNLYELAVIAEESSDSQRILDTAALVLPDGNMKMLAAFCRIYNSYYGDAAEFFRQADYAEHSNAVAIPEIPKLKEAIDILGLYGISLELEYGDTFTSCAEDVGYGNSGYLLMPYSDPSEGRLRSFDKLRSKYGLKIHSVLYISDETGSEYAYQLCGLGFSEDMPIPVTRMSFSAETKKDPVKYLHAVEAFDTEIISAELERNGDSARIKAVLSIEHTDKKTLGGMFMYLNSVADITIDGVYAEIHHKSKGL